jgi:hypothetical protein
MHKNSDTRLAARRQVIRLFKIPRGQTSSMIAIVFYPSKYVNMYKRDGRGQSGKYSQILELFIWKIEEWSLTILSNMQEYSSKSTTPVFEKFIQRA